MTMKTRVLNISASAALRAAFNRLQFRAILSNTRHFDAHCTTTLYRPLNRRLCSLPLTSQPRTVVRHPVLRR